MDQPLATTGGGGELATVDASPSSIQDLVRHAIDKDIPAESLEKLVGVMERVTDRNATMEFARALADFQSNCPPIQKNKTAKINTTGGGSYSYKYASLDSIDRTVKPELHARGLAYSWDTVADGSGIRVTCTLRHVNGHSVSSSFTAPVDSAAKMSGAQRAASAVTYASRYSLIQVLGLTTTDEDTDDGPPPQKISDDQCLNLNALMDEVDADTARFLSYMGVLSLSDITVADFPRAISALERKRKRSAT